MARGTWKGNISFGLVNIPVSLYPAETYDKISFHMLDKRDMSPIHYKVVNANTDEEVSRKMLVKGYEYRKGDFVILTDEDFKKANVKATKTIEIENFVERSEIDPGFYSKPYYVEPGESAAKSYALLRETLARTEKVGIAKIVMSGREHLCALMVKGEALMLELLRFAHEIKKPDQKTLPPKDLKKIGVKNEEIKMAEALVESMTGKFDPSKYKDTYQDDLKEFIRDKLKHGEHAKARHVEEANEDEDKTSNVVDFMSLLKKSVDRAHGGKSKTTSKSQRHRGSHSHAQH